MLDARAREALEGVARFTGRVLSKLHLTADGLTMLGVVFTALAAWRIAYGSLFPGALLLTAGSVLDFCDGAVARVQGTASRRGAFLDSVTDRISDSLVFSALLWYFFVRAPDHAMAIVVLVSYGLAVLTSYIRGKAESLGFDCKVGILERAERMIVVCFALGISFLLKPLFWALLALSAITVVQRLVHVNKQARADA